MNNWKKAVIALSFCLINTGVVPAFASVNPDAKAPSLVVSEKKAPTVSAQAGAYENVAISRVSDYVNVRSEASTKGQIVGKIYNNCAATILETVSGEGGDWYRIQSGSVTGYIKACLLYTSPSPRDS